MSLDPEQEPTIEPQDALDPQAEESGPEDDLGDASASGGDGFITRPIAR